MKNLFNIQYTKKFPFIKVSKKDFFAIFMIASAMGFLAFIYETLLDLLITNNLYDRGFLIGPFIPLYFFITFFVLLIFKTPKPNFWGFIKCFLFASIGISTIEFIVGNLCELVFGAVLWNYEGFMPLSYKYVSLTVALIWGAIGTFLVMIVFPFLKNKVDIIKSKYHKIFYIIFTTILVTDFIASCILVIINKGYKELYIYEGNLLSTIIITGATLIFLIVCLIFLLAMEPEYRICGDDIDKYKTKYPFVLVHGMILKDFKLFKSFRKIRDILEENGVIVYASNQDGIGRVPTNAKQLKEEILMILEKENVDKVNIIAHSKGGLDSRFMISKLKMDDKVASLTTLSTPHHGSKLAERLLKLPKFIRYPVEFFVNTFYKLCKDKEPDIIGLGTQLTKKNMKEFNEYVTNSPKVYYQSFSSNIKNKDIFISKIPDEILTYIENDHTDGIVSVSSAMWGDYKGNKSFDHIEMVGVYGNKKKLFKVALWYLDIIEDLKKKGF